MSVIYDSPLIMCATRLLHASSPRGSFITYACVDETPVGNAQTLANTIQGRFATNWAAQIDTNVTIGPTKVILGNSTPAPAIATSNIANTAGSRALSSPPPNNNMLISKSTGFGGRMNRGRIYLPWSFDETGVDEVGVLTAGEVSGAQTRATAWLAGLDTDGTKMVIANKVLTPPLTTFVAGIPVTALVVQSLIGSQRRRLGR